jgi:hypothetical protein
MGFTMRGHGIFAVSSIILCRGVLTGTVPGPFVGWAI